MPRNRSETYRAIVAPATLFLYASNQEGNESAIVAIDWTQEFANRLQDLWRISDDIDSKGFRFCNIDFLQPFQVYKRQNGAHEWVDSMYEGWNSDDPLIMAAAPPPGIDLWERMPSYANRIEVRANWTGFHFYHARWDSRFDSMHELGRDDIKLFRGPR